MLKSLQAGSGLLFAVFVVMHLTNTWLAALGPGAYNETQQLLRTIYQFPPLEALLLAALAVHIVVGVMRIVQEPKRELNLRARLHRYAGFFLLLVIFGHIAAVRGPSWMFEIYPGFEGLAFSIDFAPAYFLPYYFLLGLTGFYHGLNGIGIALTRLGFRATIGPQMLRATTGFAGVLMIAALMGFSGVWTDPGDLTENEFAQLALGILNGDPLPTTHE